MFPSCDVKDVSRTLMMSQKFTDLLPDGFDMMPCFGESAASKTFQIVMVIDIPWLPEYRNSSQFEQEILDQLEAMVMNTTYADVIDYVKVIDISPGSVVVTILVEYNVVLRVTDVRQGTLELVGKVQADPTTKLYLMQKVDLKRIQVTVADSNGTGVDFCMSHDESMDDLFAQCHTISPTSMRENAGHVFCSLYDVYLTCMHKMIEEKEGKRCRKTSLHSWLPFVIPTATNFTAADAQSCNVTDESRDFCGDVQTLENIAFYGVCNGYNVGLPYYQDCQKVILPYLGCLRRSFPSCDAKDIAPTLMKSPAFRKLLPEGYDMMTCFPDAVSECNSVERIKSVVKESCDSSRNQLVLVDNKEKCGVFLDMLGCTLFNVPTCSPGQIVKTMNKDLAAVIEKALPEFNTSTCYASEDNIVFPTIVPATDQIPPCRNPDTLRYLMKYNCYYDGFGEFVQGKSVEESCRYYWYASSCVYSYLKDSPSLGSCSYTEVQHALIQYDEELFEMSPSNANASICYDQSHDYDPCVTALFDPQTTSKYFTCYSMVTLSRANLFLDTKGLDCIIYPEAMECGYRIYKRNGYGFCRKDVFEQNWIWYSNSANSIMSKAMGANLTHPNVVEGCLVNRSMDMDFGQDLCQDTRGLVMAGITCILRLQFSPDTCGTLWSEYVPCLIKTAAEQKYNCSMGVIARDIFSHADLIKHLIKKDILNCVGTNGTVTPPSETGFKTFRIELRFELPWQPEYDNSTAAMETILLQQVNAMIANSSVSDAVDFVKIIDVRRGSIVVTLVVGLLSETSLEDMRMTTVQLFTSVQGNMSPQYSMLQKVDIDNISVSLERDVPAPTTSSPPIVPSCSSEQYLQRLVSDSCDSARNQLTLVDDSKKCKVFIDLIGCVAWQSRICSPEDVMMTIKKNFAVNIGVDLQNFDPMTCFVPGDEIVVPTIVPLNATVRPCVNPDVINYILNYDCHYSGLQENMGGETTAEQCRFYWFSSVCVYGAISGNPLLGMCSHQEVVDILTMYEDRLFQISPKNINASVCFDYDRSQDRCSTVFYEPDVYHYFFDCYSNSLLTNEMKFDTDGLKCLLYEKSSECMYRFYKKEASMCDSRIFEKEVVWFMSSVNSVMNVATGKIGDSEDVIEGCIGNVTRSSDFGGDLCSDSDGLVLSDTTCLLNLQFSPDICSDLRRKYIPCLMNKANNYNISCKMDVVYDSIMKERDLLWAMSNGKIDLNKCKNNTSDKVKFGNCPVVTNGTVGICVQECSHDSYCTGNQKCCFNGCGHTCVEAVSRLFNITFLFNITWDPVYSNRNSTKYQTMTNRIYNQLNSMVSNSTVGYLVDWIRIMGLRRGSVIADVAVSFLTDLTPSDVQQTTVMLVQTVQSDPTSQLDIIKAADISRILVSVVSDDSKTDNNEDVCTNIMDIQTEFSTCAIYLYKFVDSSNHNIDCRMYNFFIDCVVNMVTMTGRKCNVDSLSSAVERNLGMLGKPGLENLRNCPDYDDDKCHDRKAIQHIFFRGCNMTLESIRIMPTCQTLNMVLDSCMFMVMPGIRCDRDVILTAVTNITEVAQSLPRNFNVATCISKNGTFDKGKPGNCPVVTNETVGICVEECIYDGKCTGNQKCCFNGCGHTCMEPVSRLFNITFLFNISWDPDYSWNSTKYQTMTDRIYNQLNSMVSNSSVGYLVDWIRIMGLRRGSVMADVAVSFLTDLTPLDVQQTTVMLVQSVQSDPTSQLDIIKAVDVGRILISVISDNNNEDVCTNIMDIQTELSSCAVYLFTFVDSSNHNMDCRMYNFFIDCVVHMVTMAGVRKCNVDSLSIAVDRNLGMLGRPALENLRNCPDYDDDDKCYDRKAIQHIFFRGCNMTLESIQRMPTCQTLNMVLDTCMYSVMPGIRCGRDVILVAVTNITEVAQSLPEDFNVATCNSKNGTFDKEKPGNCPVVTNGTVGICVEECSYDSYCTGNQKCCFNGCGHTCVEAVSRLFNITFLFNMTWDPDYSNRNSTKYQTMTDRIYDQLKTMLVNSPVWTLIDSIRIMGLRRGSVMADVAVSFFTDLTPSDVQQTTVMLVQSVQSDPTSQLDIIKAADVSRILVSVVSDNSKTDNNEDVCTNIMDIQTEFSTCAIYLNAYVNFSNPSVDCRMYNFFFDCVVNMVTMAGKKCNVDSLSVAVDRNLGMMGKPGLENLRNCPDYDDDKCYDGDAIRHIFFQGCYNILESIQRMPTCQTLNMVLDSCMYMVMPGVKCDAEVILAAITNITEVAQSLPEDFSVQSCDNNSKTDNNEDVCTNIMDIQTEVATCLIYLGTFVDFSNPSMDCRMYNFFIDCVVNMVTMPGKKCNVDSLSVSVERNFGMMGKPGLETLRNCTDYDDDKCYDGDAIRHIFFRVCNMTLEFIQRLPTCQTLNMVLDTCMYRVMPGVKCDRDVILAAVTNITEVAQSLPEDFSVASCDNGFAPSCRNYGEGMMRENVQQCFDPFKDVVFGSIPQGVSCRMYEVLLNCINEEQKRNGVQCDVMSLHAWMPDHMLSRMIADPSVIVLKNCSVGMMKPTAICRDINVLEDFGNYGSCRQKFANFSRDPNCGLGMEAFGCIANILPQCLPMEVYGVMLTMPLYQSYIPQGFDITACMSTDDGDDIPVVTAPPVKPGGDEICRGSWGSCVSNTNCHMVMWSYNPQTEMISFNLTAAIGSDKWLGIGFNKDQMMTGTNAVVGWVSSNGRTTVTDRYATGYVMPELVEPSDISIIRGSHVDGITNIAFRRPLNTSNTAKDFQFSKTSCAYFVYAIGGTYNDGDRSITKHQNTPTISTEKYCFPCAETTGDKCTSMDTFRKIGTSTCKTPIDNFISGESDDQFCMKLSALDSCTKGALPSYGCSTDIADVTYLGLLGLLDELVGFQASAQATRC